ncbi:16873_t:CDS:2, partial [Entrophospora sp. SA101]
FPQIPQHDILQITAQFNQLDIDGNGALEQKEVLKALQDMGESSSYDEIRATLKEIDLSSTGKVELEEFVETIAKLRSGRNKSAFAVNKHKITVHGSSQNVSHTINEDERTEFTRHMNQTLSGDPDLADKLPINISNMQLFDECRVPDTIDERVLNVFKKGKKINKFQMIENNNLVIFSAKGIGCNVVNIGSADLIEGREHLILGLIWQIIKIGSDNVILPTKRPIPASTSTVSTTTTNLKKRTAATVAQQQQLKNQQNVNNVVEKKQKIEEINQITSKAIAISKHKPIGSKISEKNQTKAIETRTQNKQYLQ